MEKKLTTEGMYDTRLFFSIVDTRLGACSATIELSFSPDVVAAAWRVSMTLARISLSGRSSPRRRRGMSCTQAYVSENSQMKDGKRCTEGISCAYVDFGTDLMRAASATRYAFCRDDSA